MLFHAYSETENITYAASTRVAMDLPKNGYITHIDVILDLNITADNTVTAATTDPLQQVIDACRISAGGETYFDVSDGRDWFYWAAMRHRGMLQVTALPTGGNTTSHARILFPLHLGYHPKNPYDPTVVIPATRLSNPRIEITFGAAADLGTGYTINSGTAYLVFHELVLEKPEYEEKIWPDGLLVPRVENATEALDTAHTNLGLRHEVPVSMVLYNTMVTILDASDDRSDTPVTEMSVELPPERETPMQFDWDDAMAINAMRTEAMSVISAEQTRTPYAGLYLLEWPLVSGNSRGIDLSQATVGSVEIGMTNAATAGGVARFLHVGYQPE